MGFIRPTNWGVLSWFDALADNFRPHAFRLSWCHSKGPYETCSIAECPQAPLLRHCLSRTRIRGRSKRRGPDLTEKDLPGLVVERSTTWRFRAQGAGAGQMKVNVPRRIFRTLRIVGGLPTALMLICNALEVNSVASCFLNF